MRRDFFPDRESDMLLWAQNMAGILQQADGHYGVREQTVQQFADLTQAFADAYAVAVTPATRTKGAVAEKNQSRRVLESAARALSRLLNGLPGISNETRIQMRINVPRPRVRHVAAPTVGPVLTVAGVKGSVVEIFLGSPQQSARGARPDNATGATLWVHVGEDELPPGKAWRFFGRTSRTRTAVSFDPKLPAGTRVWICANWNNRRAEPSPMGKAVPARLGEGVAVNRPVHARLGKGIAVGKAA